MGWTMSIVFVSLQFSSVDYLSDNWKCFFDNKKFHALTENHGLPHLIERDFQTR